MYEHLFRNLFPLIEEASGAPIRWKHIHGSGVEVVQADMCHKQASGKFLFPCGGKWCLLIVSTRPWHLLELSPSLFHVAGAHPARVNVLSRSFPPWN